MTSSGTSPGFSRWCWYEELNPPDRGASEQRLRPGSLREAGTPSLLPCPFAFPVAAPRSFHSAEFGGGWRMAAHMAACVRFFIRILRIIAFKWTFTVDSVI